MAPKRERNRRRGRKRPAGGPQACQSEGRIRDRLAKRFGRDREIVSGPLPPGQRKMSEVLKEFAEPLLDGVDSIEEYRAGIAAAATGWNVALVPDDMREEMLDKAIRAVRSDLEEAKELYRRLVERKEAHYSGDNRFVLDYEVTEDGGRFLVAVASTEKV